MRKVRVFGPEPQGIRTAAFFMHADLKVLTDTETCGEWLFNVRARNHTLNDYVLAVAYSSYVQHTSSTASDKPQIIEFRHLVLHQCRTVAQLTAVVLIVTRVHRHQRAIHDFAQCDYFEGARQRLVAAPVIRQNGADL